MDIQKATDKAVRILSEMISIESFSRQEDNVVPVIEKELVNNGYKIYRKGNNIWTYCKDYVEGNPTLMLDSHIDTVKPVKGWDTDPFTPVLENGRLTGLGSNDAGGCLVSLLQAFIITDETGLPYNRVFVASCEEEVSGANGISIVLPELKKVDCAIIGEPTCMEMAIAEKGLMVLDCEVKGVAGHAARTGGVNAITEAYKEIEWFHSFEFPKKSELLGPVKMTVTIINAGTQHNVIPSLCTFVVDVRTNEQYSNAQALEIIQNNTKAEVKARSLRLNSSYINSDHPLVQVANKLGINTFGSPTMSDQALINDFPTVKIGPGDSNRSHTANEYVMVDEIRMGIEGYIRIMNELVF